MHDSSHRSDCSECWSRSVRKLGIVSGIGLVAIGILYVAVIGLWVFLEATPREPIADPYLAVMEILTMFSALALLGLVVTVRCFAEAADRVYALIALTLASFAAGLTMAVHFVSLTAVRQLWRAGLLPDYRLVWPSPLFAVEYFVWDILIGMAMVSASFALARAPRAARARVTLAIGGALCLVGASGPFSGRMLLQNVAVFGYAVVLPVAAAFTTRLFFEARPTNGAAA